MDPALVLALAALLGAGLGGVAQLIVAMNGRQHSDRQTNVIVSKLDNGFDRATEKVAEIHTMTNSTMTRMFVLVAMLGMINVGLVMFSLREAQKPKERMA